MEIDNFNIHKKKWYYINGVPYNLCFASKNIDIYSGINRIFDLRCANTFEDDSAYENIAKSHTKLF